MYLIFLPVNQAWVFVFGEDIHTADIIPMGDAPRFLDTRAEAVAAAERCGLTVTAAGIVEVLGQSTSA